MAEKPMHCSLCGYVFNGDAEQHLLTEHRAIIAALSAPPAAHTPAFRRRSLRREWETFASDVVPKGAIYEQRKQLKQAFYAGATCMFTLMTQQVDDDKDATQEDVDYISSLFAELIAFTEELKRG